MTHPNYPDWHITKRFLLDGYPLLLLEKDRQRIVLSEGSYKNIIEFLLNVAKPHTSSPEDVNFIMHQGFMSGEGWAIAAVFYGHLIQPSEFAGYQADPEFIAELEQYQKRTGQTLHEPLWQVSVSSGDWRHAKTFIPQSSIQKIIDLEAQLLGSRSISPEGVQILSEDEWDLRFGWAAITGLRPSQLPKLEKYAAGYLKKLETKSINLEAARFVFLRALLQEGLLNREFETDAIYHQLSEAGCSNLKHCLDHGEYLYGYMNSSIRKSQDLPIINDIQQLCFSFDWLFQNTNSSLRQILTYEFMLQVERFFMAAKPQNLEPLDFGEWQLHLLMEHRTIKLSHVHQAGTAP